MLRPVGEPIGLNIKNTRMVNRIWIVIFMVLFARYSYSKTKCSCKKYLQQISDTWKMDSLGFDQVRLKEYRSVEGCRKYLIGKPIKYIHTLFGEPSKIQTENNEKYFWYDIYNEISNTRPYAYLIIIFVFDEKERLFRIKITGLDG